MKIYKRMLDEALNQIELADRICNLDELSTSEIFVLIKVVVGCDTDYFTAVEIPMPRRTFYSVIQTLMEKGFVEKQGQGYSLNLDVLYDKTHIQLPAQSGMHLRHWERVCLTYHRCSRFSKHR